jgi:hypothetical protein
MTNRSRMLIVVLTILAGLALSHPVQAQTCDGCPSICEGCPKPAPPFLLGIDNGFPTAPQIEISWSDPTTLAIARCQAYLFPTGLVCARPSSRWTMIESAFPDFGAFDIFEQTDPIDTLNEGLMIPGMTYCYRIANHGRVWSDAVCRSAPTVSLDDLPVTLAAMPNKRRIQLLLDAALNKLDFLEQHVALGLLKPGDQYEPQWRRNIVKQVIRIAHMREKIRDPLDPHWQTDPVLLPFIAAPLTGTPAQIWVSDMANNAERAYIHGRRSNIAADRMQGAVQAWLDSHKTNATAATRAKALALLADNESTQTAIYHDLVATAWPRLAGKVKRELVHDSTGPYCADSLEAMDTMLDQVQDEGLTSWELSSLLTDLPHTCTPPDWVFPDALLTPEPKFWPDTVPRTTMMGYQVALCGQTGLCASPVSQRFFDSVGGSFAYAEILTLVRTGRAVPCALNLFCPMDPVTLADFTAWARCTATGCPGAPTREQLAMWALKARHGLAYVPPPALISHFADVPLTSPSSRWIERAVAEGLVSSTNGCAAHSFCPTAPATRAWAAWSVTRTLGLH